ncbi:MAG: IS256 family transposase [Bacteroidetes bacterium SW_10_40_5]|nr:MAG: IS256 family transposase [Bacteroidetes bacterium SW_10_40_5]
MTKKRSKQKNLEDLIPDEELRTRVKDQLYNGNSVLGEGSVFTEMLQSMVNAALEGEMDAHLKEKEGEGQQAKDQPSNRRNGHTQKQVRSSGGALNISTPRDRNGTHEPQIVEKWDRELSTGMDDIILSLYARGQSVEDVRYQLQELYGIEVSKGTISAVTDRMWSEILDWQKRPLSPCYVIVYLDAIHFKVREEGKTISKAIYSCYGIDVDGQRDILSMHLSASEGARQWGLILDDLKQRGVESVLFFCVDGLSGFKEVIEEVFPEAIVQRCIVHMIRSSTRFVNHKDRKAVCSDLRKIYTSATREQASMQMEEFGKKWDTKYQEVRKKWEENWDDLMHMMDYGEHIRRMIYTTNPVEALHRIMRKTTKAKGAWSNDKALIKQLYLSLRHNRKSWDKKAYKWVEVQRELKEQFGYRYEKYLE